MMTKPPYIYTLEWFYHASFKQTIIVYIKNCSESSIIDIMYHISVSMAMHRCHLILLCIFLILCFCIVFELCSKRESNDIYILWDLLWHFFFISSPIIWVQLRQNSGWAGSVCSCKFSTLTESAVTHSDISAVTHYNQTIYPEIAPIRRHYHLSFSYENWPWNIDSVKNGFGNTDLEIYSEETQIIMIYSSFNSLDIFVLAKFLSIRNSLMIRTEPCYILMQFCNLQSVGF